MDDLGDLGDLGELRRLAEQLSKSSAAFEASVAQWSERRFTGTADKGGVVATVDAAGNLLSLEISPLSKRRLDGVTIGDAVVAAVHAGELAAAEAKEAMMRELQAGAGPHVGSLLSEAQRSFETRSGLKRDCD
ncbi:Conserved DNA-binding protein YbaB [Sinosporangium album]|uniref:Conserved DNA-binding protein YbaB n=1 Tax=Sinosporangium album TaxID=504805 RepID=A0A1G8JGF6_9ACTN|nr:YbaB/EbfC family nucleoid-associated protein [Sinosporangium album]SDI30275.1 Conserved DNA-binding protein YbaB [Sinosporangium album]